MRINTLQQGNLMTMKQLGHATKEIIEHGLLASSNNINNRNYVISASFPMLMHELYDDKLLKEKQTIK